jgi:hypothetical protein
MYPHPLTPSQHSAWLVENWSNFTFLIIMWNQINNKAKRHVTVLFDFWFEARK